MQNDFFTTQTETASTASATTATAEVIAPNWRLHSLYVYNWGSFGGGIHRAEFDRSNSAIVGATGSGKTTLVDALMTLLCARPRYNLASTGGHENDRDLLSYVRGASSPGQVQRSGRFVAGLAAEFHCQQTDGTQDRVLLGAVFWQESASLRHRWLFAQGPGHSLDEWLEEHHSGGAAALTRLEKAREGLRNFNSKSAYLARVQSFFEVGPNAFTLLNRAAGLKQLNSIDEIFRELVLDDHSAFDQALRIAAGFDELTAIHEEMELANRQYLSLLPLQELAQRAQRQQQRLGQWQQLQQALPLWLAEQGVRLWQERCSTLEQAAAEGQQAITHAQTAWQQARSTEQSLLETYLRTGGQHIDLLQEKLAYQRQALRQREHTQTDYLRLVRNLGLSHATAHADTGHPLTAEQLAADQAQASTALAALTQAQQAQQQALDSAIAQEHNQHSLVQSLSDELEQAKRTPGSNLPAEFLAFRADLAAHLHLQPGQLPFVAELVQVPPQEQAWRGAIERALGHQRLRILVPQAHAPAALQWVNQRHNRLHVRLLEVPRPKPNTAPVEFWEDGFVCKLELKPHALQPALRQLLAAQDRHCVESTEALQTTAHAMTREGLMSGKAGFFEKNDRQALHDNWLTGFDNRDRLAQLQAQLSAAHEAWQPLQQAKTQARQAQQQLQQQERLWQQLQNLQFADLDTHSSSTQVAQLEQQIADLLDPKSDTAQAKARWQAAQTASEQADTALRQLEQAQAVRHSRVQTAQQQMQHYQRQHQTRTTAQPGAAWTDELAALLRAAKGLPALEDLSCDTLPTQERQWLDYTQEQGSKQAALLASIHTDIVRQMGKALKEDRGHLADQPEELAALPAYLERLRLLQEEALPEKRQRFQAYLNDTSDQGVSVLLSSIETQVQAITERIEQLNTTLAQVNFQCGCYLQLVHHNVIHPSLQALEKLRRQLVSDRLADDDGTSHYRSLQALVQLLREHAENRRTKAAQALLDPRYRLQFAVHVLDRASGKVLEERTGSQGGSGGEKESIASYVLTASLSYALCPQGRQHPLFATIVLDEAFSKSSQAVAARIIEALRQFGLHALFVTPNKEMHLLRQHTRSAVVVHRQGPQARLLNMRWEELVHQQNQSKPPQP